MTSSGLRLLVAGLICAVIGCSSPAWAEKRVFNMTIEDTTITLVDKQTFHTFAFDGQVPGPLIHVTEGDDVEVNVENQTTLPHTIHWHGLLHAPLLPSAGTAEARATR